jgi:hypothetical protein
MRFDTPVRFVKMADVYDESTGNYSSSVVNEVTHYASVDNTTERMMTLVYGGVMQDSITARFQNHITDEYTDIVIDGKAYKVDYIAPKRVKDVYVLSRV